MRVVIIGGVAGGASAAARLRRLSEAAEITIIERGPDASFANCGMPYFISGEINDRNRLNVQTPETLKQLLNLDVLTMTEVLNIDRQQKTLRIKTRTGELQNFSYDKLIIATGASPKILPVFQADYESALENNEALPIFTLRTLQNMDQIKTVLATRKPNRVAIIGAGFIGLEMAEALVNAGTNVSVIEVRDQVMVLMDKEMTYDVKRELVDRGVELHLGVTVERMEKLEPKGGANLLLSSGKTVHVDAILLSVGVTPDSELAKEAGINLGIRGSIVVNKYQQTSDPDIYAVGDVTETSDLVLQKRVNVPLGGPANRQGRVAADHIIFGERAQPYPGTLGTAIVRVFDTNAGIVGWSESALLREKIPYRATVVNGSHHATYYPGAVALRVKVLWDPNDGRILGGQVVGGEGVDKRLDVLSTAISGKMCVEDLAHLELAYAPPFGSAKDIINMVGFAATNVRLGLVSPLSIDDVTDIIKKSDDAHPSPIVVDVRSDSEVQTDPAPKIFHPINIPLENLRSRMNELDNSRPIITICNQGKFSYFASRILAQNGFNVTSVAGGVSILHGVDEFSHKHYPPIQQHKE